MKTMEKLARTARVLLKIKTEHLLTTNPQHYCYTNQLGPDNTAS
jgi:hypothetical protein